MPLNQKIPHNPLYIKKLNFQDKIKRKITDFINSGRKLNNKNNTPKNDKSKKIKRKLSSNMLNVSNSENITNENKNKNIKKRREEWKTKGKKYHDELVKEEQHLIEAKREARNNGNFYMAPEAKVAFVIRIKGVNHIRPQVKKILRLLRLRQLNNGVFVKVNKATMNMIKRVEPYVVYGYPNRKTISDLIYKRGFAKINHSRIPLSDNMIIEQSLGNFGINCVEDLIEEIYRVGPHFKEANSFLWTFKMNNPRGGWSNKNHSFQNGGDWGNREEEINKLIRKMN